MTNIVGNNKKPKTVNFQAIEAKTHCERLSNELVSKQRELELDIKTLKEICGKEHYQMNSQNTSTYQRIKGKYFKGALHLGGKRKTRARAKRHHRRTTRKH